MLKTGEKPRKIGQNHKKSETRGKSNFALGLIFKAMLKHMTLDHVFSYISVINGSMCKTLCKKVP